MSAYICNDPTILLVALWCCKGPEDPELPRTVKVLVEQNYASVNYRYDEDVEPHEIDLDPQVLEILHAVSPERAWGAIACYDYQSCETPDWPQTEAQRLVQEALTDVEGASKGGRKGWELPVNEKDVWSEDEQPLEEHLLRLWEVLERKNQGQLDL